MDGRRKGKLPHPGPYLAEITNHLDSTYMGRLEVTLKKAIPGKVAKQGETYAVKYLSPFYGATSARFEGNNSGSFNDVQKSYGMWMIPPDVGSTVMVIFVDGDPNEGYWFGCVMNDVYQNHMVPGIAASDKVTMTAEQRRKYGTDYLPVAEFNKKTQTLSNPNPESFARPVHPFADRLLAQGLLMDKIRGVTSSSARRDTPSSVFGISTPGPLDVNGPKGKVGYNGNKQTPISRLGGSTFVMDDGDRSGQNELVRIRTRTGHQILLHNSSDLIYIANSQGTAWIELTSNGKIDMYAADSVSIHSEADFNFRADRDVNIEAGRNFNVSVGENKNVNVGQNYTLIAQDGSLFFGGSLDQSVATGMKLTVGADMHLKASNMFQTAAGTFNVLGTTNKFSANGDTNISSGGMHLETASKIHMNGPGAAIATQATVAGTPTKLRLYSLPNRSPTAGWANGAFYKSGSLSSIMQRVPTHEPWDQHESTDPSKYNKFSTDAVVGATKAGSTNSANAAAPEPNKNVPSDWSKDLEFINKVKTVSGNLGCNYVDLLCCMQFESGMNPAQRNLAGGSATGLIQFLEVTAQKLGTTTAILAGMTRVQQMDYVEQYFNKFTPIKKIKSPALSDVYMGILAPAYCGKSDNYPVYSKANSPQAYYANAGLDANGDGTITKAEAAAKPLAKMPYVKQQLVLAGVEKA